MQKRYVGRGKISKDYSELIELFSIYVGSMRDTIHKNVEELFRTELFLRAIVSNKVALLLY